MPKLLQSAIVATGITVQSVKYAREIDEATQTEVLREIVEYAYLDRAGKTVEVRHEGADAPATLPEDIKAYMGVKAAVKALSETLDAL